RAGRSRICRRAIAADLIRAGIEVHVFNQRGVGEILESIAMLGRMIGAHARAQALIGRLRRSIDNARRAASRLPCRPRVYFEEWDDPLICGIRWVGELVEIAGAENCFADLAARPAAKERIIADPQEVVRRAPDVLIASWCGKKFNPARVRERPGVGIDSGAPPRSIIRD
ncbi:periplasmic binding protein, partial [mine drainage metagenome]